MDFGNSFNSFHWIYCYIICRCFSLMLGLMLANGLLYNYFLKDIAFADIISLSTIYIWRALAGCVLIDVTISPWLTIAVFLTALFLATGKRIADLSLMGKNLLIITKNIQRILS